MFSKGTWTVLGLRAPEGGDTAIETFKKNFEANQGDLIPLLAISKALDEKTTTVGLSPYSNPRLGDELELEVLDNGKSRVDPMDSFLVDWTPHTWAYSAADQKITLNNQSVKLEPTFWQSDLDLWSIAPGVYGAWFMVFEYTDVQDSNSKKEQMAYEYGAPFKLQGGELKKQIQDAVETANAMTRKHHQVILDFNTNRLWVNSGSKAVIELLLGLAEKLGLSLCTPEVMGDQDALGGDRIRATLTNLFNASTIADEATERLNSVKLHGPDGIEPHENATMEKILKAFYAFSEHDGYYIGMSTPAAIHLYENMPTPTPAKSNFEVTEFMHLSEEATINETGVMFTEYRDKVWSSDSAFTPLPACSSRNSPALSSRV
jgi:hypothetical protein